MKTTIIAIAGLLGTCLSGLGAEMATTVRVDGDWVIITYARDHQKFGSLPWIHAIQRKVITSASVLSDFSAMFAEDVREPGTLDVAPEEKIDQIPAVIEIVTTERAHDGGGKKYEVHGLTHGTAPAFLAEIRRAVSSQAD